MPPSCVCAAVLRFCLPPHAPPAVLARERTHGASLQLILQWLLRGPATAKLMYCVKSRYKGLCTSKVADSRWLAAR